MNDQHYTTEHATVVGMPDQTKELNGSPATETLQVAFSAEFHIDANDPALAANDVHDRVRRSFQDFIDTREIGHDGSITGEAALGELTSTSDTPDYMVTSSIIGEMTSCNGECSDNAEYLAIASSPSVFNEAMGMLLETTDKMSSESIHTSAPTEMTIRVTLPDDDKIICPLELILGLSEGRWLERFGRSKAVTPDEASWIKLTLTDVLLQEYFQRPERLTADHGLEVWLTHLTNLAEHVVSEGLDGVSATSIHADRKSVDFFHIGGERYEDDFMLIHQTLTEMGDAVAGSARNSGVITRPETFSELRFNNFVRRILKLQEFVDAVEEKDTSAPFVSKLLVKDGETVGHVKDMGVDMVKVGNIAVPAETGNSDIYPFLAALLSERLGNT